MPLPASEEIDSFPMFHESQSPEIVDLVEDDDKIEDIQCTPDISYYPKPIEMVQCPEEQLNSYL